MPEQDDPPELILTFPEEGLRAVISTIHLRTTVAQIEALLEAHGVCVGISERRIRQAIRSVRHTNRPAYDVVVAEGQRPRAPSRPRLTNHWATRDADKAPELPPDATDALPLLDPIQALLSADDDEVRRQAPRLSAWAVAPGDLLVSIDQTQGSEGLDVRGQALPIPELPENLIGPGLEAGPGVSLVDGVNFVSATYGYVGRHEDRICVLDPVWISPDMMQACFLYVPTWPGSRSPTATDLQNLLEASGILFGMDAEAIQQAAERLAIWMGRAAGQPARETHDGAAHSVSDAVQESLIPLAVGEQPGSATTWSPAFLDRWSFRTGSFREDGSVDFHERNLFPAVEEGELLAECDTQVSGPPGHTIFGVEIDAIGGPITVELIAGENVRLEVEENRQRLFATSGGGVLLSPRVLRSPEGDITGRQYHMLVQPVAHIESDVGLAVGNIDFNGSVIIDESVTGGFRVKATGGIAVAGSIEAGACLEAGGDITIEQGIVGRDTHIRAGGAVSARFIQEAQVSAGGSIHVGSYVHSAQLQAQGRILLAGLGGSSRAGGIVGGHTWALQGITARNVGSARSSSTHLFAGISADDLKRLEQARQDLERAEGEFSRHLRSMGLKELTAEAVRELITRSPDRREEILAAVKPGQRLQADRDHRLEDEVILRRRLAAIACEADIIVSDRAFADVSIQIGDRQLTLVQDLFQVRFHLEPQAPDLVVQPLQPPRPDEDDTQ